MTSIIVKNRTSPRRYCTQCRWNHLRTEDAECLPTGVLSTVRHLPRTISFSNQLSCSNSRSVHVWTHTAAMALYKTTNWANWTQIESTKLNDENHLDLAVTHLVHRPLFRCSWNLNVFCFWARKIFELNFIKLCFSFQCKNLKNTSPEGFINIKAFV